MLTFRHTDEVSPTKSACEGGAREEGSKEGREGGRRGIRMQHLCVCCTLGKWRLYGEKN